MTTMISTERASEIIQTFMDHHRHIYHVWLPLAARGQADRYLRLPITVDILSDGLKAIAGEPVPMTDVTFEYRRDRTGWQIVSDGIVLMKGHG